MLRFMTSCFISLFARNVGNIVFCSLNTDKRNVLVDENYKNRNSFFSRSHFPLFLDKKPNENTKKRKKKKERKKKIVSQPDQVSFYFSFALLLANITAVAFIFSYLFVKGYRFKNICCTKDSQKDFIKGISQIF